MNSNCPYNVIDGRDLLMKMRMGFDFNEMSLTASGKTVEKMPKHFYQNSFAALLDMVKEYDNTKDMEEDVSTLSSYCNTPQEITKSHYKKVDVDAVVKQQKHPSMEQQNKLSNIFHERTKLFSRKLGHYPHKKMDLELLQGAQPVH
jgi:hypothetical protein